MKSTKNDPKRRYTSMACVSCRESKVKCDGKLPSCSHCVRKDRQCRYGAMDKRKLPLRVGIELLAYRVEELCHFIRDNGLEPPEMPDEKETTLRNILDTLAIPSPNDTKSHTVKENGKQVPDSTTVSYLDPAPVTVIGEGELNRSAAINVPVAMNSHCLPDSSFPQIPHQNCDPIPFSDDLSVFTGESPDIIPNSWLCDLELGPHMAASGLDPKGQQVNIPAMIDMESIGAADSEGGSSFTEDQGATSDIEALVDEISDRLGTVKISNSGKTRFYGPTSTFNLREIPFLDNYESNYLTPSYGSEPEEEIPTALEEHLLDLYFSWQDPLFHVVDRAIYEDAKEKWKNLEETPFYSDSLRNAMCALGSAFECRYHPTMITFPKTLVEFFADRAKSTLETELDSPSVATIQAMVILSSHEIGNGKDARGWLYSGSALRLAFDLALHLDMSSHVSAGIISAAHADLRRTVFWTAWVVDHQLGFHLGRPFRTNMEDVTVGKPYQNSGARDHRRWTPHESLSANPGAGLLDSQDSICQRLVSLCELMAPCGYILYGTSSISKEKLQVLNAKIVAELRKWKATLPPNLRINLDDFTSPYLPHVLVLHMQYHQNIIYAHRPWISKSHLQLQPPKGPGWTHAREMCIQSAIAISKILKMYESRYTLRRINVQAVSITSSAILFLLFANFSNGPSCPGDEISRYLTTCFRALDEFALCWKSAHRARDILVGLQHQWDLRARLGSHGTRRTDEVFYPRKRSKTASGSHNMAPVPHDQALQIDFDLDCILGSDVGND